MTHNGFHHVTAIAGSASRNLDFYTRVLGLRLVKKTVNFDDPGTYHLYYGDDIGTPGTIMTFFPWEQARPGRVGVGETEETAFRVPLAAMGYWTHRLIEKNVAYEPPVKRFGQPVLAFTDPDGLRLALVGVAGADDTPGASRSEVPADHAIRGFHGVTLMLKDASATGAILQDVFGFAESGREGTRIRFVTSDDPVGGVVDLHAVGDFLPGVAGAGTVHHIAFRAADDAVQAAMVRQLAANHGLRTTEQRDRNYFRSVYFKEPGGVLFEIATDVPGFAVDEPAATLGQALKLPQGLEQYRRGIEEVLPELV